MTPIQWSGEEESKPAPGPLRRVQAFINTLDRESGQDRLSTEADARTWLLEYDLLAPGATPAADDLRLLAGVREGLRALVVHNSGGPAPDGTASAALRGITETSVARAFVDPNGRVVVVPDGDSVSSRLLSLLLIIRDAQVDGSWTHMKACANEDCRWVFYDRSRNHGGTWCDMATCGNKLKNRDFRARRKRRADGLH